MEDPGDHDARTVFVRNVSWSVDDSQLETLFAEVGPVRQAFVVKGKNQAHHKGYGFVQYAIPEDAERAVQELHGKEAGGRRLKVEAAKKRAPLEQRKKRKLGAPGAGAADAAPPRATDEHAANTALASAPSKRRKLGHPAGADGAGADARTAAAAAADKHKLTSTVVLGGLTPAAVAPALALARSAGRVVEVVDPAPADALRKLHTATDGCTGTTLLVVYDSMKAAMEAVPKLHSRIIHTGKAAAKAKQRRAQQSEAGDGGGGVGADAVRLWARQAAGEGAHVKKWRIILRNLPFKVQEGEIRKLLAPAGFVWEVTLPRKEDGGLRGFAFAAFTCHQHAEAAIVAANGQLLRKRPLAADWAIGRAAYEQARQQGLVGAGAGPTPGGDQAGSGGEDSGSGSGSGSDNDGAAWLDREEGAEEEGQEAEEEAEEKSSSEDDASDDDGSDGDAGGSGSDAEEQRMLRSVAAGVLNQLEEEGAGDGGAGDAAAAVPRQQLRKQHALEPARRGEEGEGDARAGANGGVAGAASPPVVSDTVFVRGLSLDTTSQQLQARLERFGRVKACRLVMNKDTNKPKGTAFVEFWDAPSAAAAVAACTRARKGRGMDIVVNGRTLDVDLALGKEAARNLATSQAADRAASKDRRNLYLAKEGAIEEGSVAWEEMGEADRAKRRRAAQEKRLKLRSPNFAVSPVRLSVRNIPASWDEKRLKALFLSAIKERATKERPRIKQVKVLRDPGRLDAEGAPRSKGIGFVEFTEPDHALAALRQLNNNPAPWGRERRPIVEFALENVKILKAREDQLAKQAARRQQQQQEAAGGAASTPPGEANAAQRGRKRARAGEGPGAASDVPDSGANGAASAAAEGAGNDTGAGTPAEAAAGKAQHRKGRHIESRAPTTRAATAGAAAANGNSAGPPAGADDAPAGRKQRRKERRPRKKPATPAAANGGAPGDGLPAAKRRKGSGDAAQPALTTAAAIKQQVKGPAAGAASGARCAGAAAALRSPVVEEAAAQRKRRADADIDALAAWGERGRGGTRARGGGSAAKRVRRQGQDRQEERLEHLVEQYKARMFGSGPSTARAGGSQRHGAVSSTAASIKRWFE